VVCFGGSRPEGVLVPGQRDEQVVRVVDIIKKEIKTRYFVSTMRVRPLYGSKCFNILALCSAVLYSYLLCDDDVSTDEDHLISYRAGC